MIKDISAIDHIFKAIGRDFNEEIPELTLVFILYNEESPTEAMAKRQAEIQTHPAGNNLLQNIEAQLKNQPHKSFFTGLTEHIDTKAFGLIKNPHYIGACFLYTPEIPEFEDQNFACKLSAYSLAFEALHQYFKAKKKQTEESTELKIHQLRLKLMGDAYAAMLLESQGHKNAIQTIAKRYCEFITQPTAHFKAEHHPLLMALDGVNVVYKDLKGQASPKISQLEHIHMMAEEIGATYDDTTLKQWLHFAQNTQDMAWAEYSPNEILSAAIYGTESPYTRATAHICAETLNTNPVPLKNTEIYNPFTDRDINERLHNRICRAAFLELLESVNEHEKPELFLKTARAQTTYFLNGRPMGWCAPALIEAENAYRLFQETRNAEEEMIDNAFQSALTHIKWPDIQRLNRLFIIARRAGKELTPELALAILERDEAFASYKNAFELLKA